jgi:hypothetical protein
VQLATIQALARYWTTNYDWRACEARLNALAQFETEIDEVDTSGTSIRNLTSRETGGRRCFPRASTHASACEWARRCYWFACERNLAQRVIATRLGGVRVNYGSPYPPVAGIPYRAKVAALGALGSSRR